jgi:DNA-binding transcriptional MerR regulator
MKGDYSVTLSLAQAAELAGVSVSTLRRLMKQGQLEIEPRESSRSPIQVSTQALLKAGLELKPRLDLSPNRVSSLEQAFRAAGSQVAQMNSQPPVLEYSPGKAEGVESDLRAEIERLKARELELVERASRAEGEAAALLSLVPSLEQALKALNTQLDTQVDSQRPVIEYSLDTQRVGLLERLRGRKKGSQGL